MLRTEITCYNGNTVNCTTTSVPLGITQVNSIVQLPGGKQSQRVTQLNPYGLPIEIDDYDWGNNTVGSVKRKESITYWSSIPDRPTEVKITDGSGVVYADTTYAYDGGGTSPTQPTPTSGTPQLAANTSWRGNLTSITYHNVGPSPLTKSFSYFDTGLLQSVTDVQGSTAVTKYTYNSTGCPNSLLTKITLPVVVNGSNLTTTFSADCNGSVVTQSNDENNQPTYFTYNDPYYWRLTKVQDAAGNITNKSYPSGINVTDSSMVFNAGSSVTETRTTFDGLGRAQYVQHQQSPTATTYDSEETDYDTNGRVAKVSAPYSAAAATAAGTSIAKALYAYDGLNRVTSITDTGGGTITYAYNVGGQNDTLQTVGPQVIVPQVENTKQRQFEYDGLGRLTSVCEVTAGTTQWPGGSCGQSVVKTGYWTVYAYDPLGNLISITQNQQSNSNQQTRTFTYDGLNRLTKEVNPETGTTVYTYDTADSNCNSYSSKGDLVERKDNASNFSCYQYDAIHRLTQITYPSSNPNPTTEKHFVYDSATLNINGTSTTMAYALGRLAEAYTGPSSGKVTDEGLSYSVLGQVIDNYQWSTDSGTPPNGWYHVSTTYWPNGLPNQLTIPGVPTIAYGGTASPATLDGEGRPTIVTASTGTNPVTGMGATPYNIFGEPTAVTFGSGDSDSFSYDTNTGRMLQYETTSGSTSIYGALTWNGNGSLQQLAITDPYNANDQQTCTYSHDDLMRIGGTNCVNGGTTIWSQTFTYDPFGNINKSGNQNFQNGYSAGTNHVTGFGYDANGDIISDTWHSYSWDAEHCPVTIGTHSQICDAFGRIVEVGQSWGTEEILWGPTGKLGVMQGQTLVYAYVPLPSGAIGTYKSGAFSYRHADWLGSMRVSTNATSSIKGDIAYAPFGEPYNGAGSPDQEFTGQPQDIDWGSTSGLYDFTFREYHAASGRWISPDPIGLGAVDVNNPQSWNRYAYALNNPLSVTDPLGTCSAFGGIKGGPCNKGNTEDESMIQQAWTSGCGPGQELSSDCVNGWDEFDALTIPGPDSPPIEYLAVDSEFVSTGIVIDYMFYTLNPDLLALLSSTAIGQYQTPGPCGKIAPSIKPVPGQDVNANIEASYHHFSLQWFHDMFGDRSSPWNFHSLGGAYNDFGNFNFGATCAAFGHGALPATFCLQEAGAVAAAHGTSNPAWGSPGWGSGLYRVPFTGNGPNYGKDPADVFWIDQGMRYYQAEHKVCK